MNEKKNIVEMLKDLTEYVDMLNSGNYSGDYIIGKVELTANRIAEQAKFTHRYINEEKEHNKEVK